MIYMLLKFKKIHENMQLKQYLFLKFKHYTLYEFLSVIQYGNPNIHSF